MNPYEKQMLSLRGQITKLTLQQEKEVINVYKGSIYNLSNRLKNGFEKDLLNNIKDEVKFLETNLNKTMQDGVIKSATKAIDGQEKIVQDVFGKLGIPFDAEGMFAQVHMNVLCDIIGGGLYKDGLSLSNRVWDLADGAGQDIQIIIGEGLTQKKSAEDLAKDLEIYLQPPEKRPTDWGKAYKTLKNKKIDYRAMRLARTSINHSYQTATIQASQENPFVEAISWRSAMQHGRTCQLCMDRAQKDYYNKGAGIYPKDKVPLDHPNGLCTMIPYISKTLEEVSQELRDWIDGKVDNPELDKWFDLLSSKPSKKVKDNLVFHKNGNVNFSKSTFSSDENYQFVKNYEATKKKKLTYLSKSGKDEIVYFKNGKVNFSESKFATKESYNQFKNSGVADVKKPIIKKVDIVGKTDKTGIRARFEKLKD